MPSSSAATTKGQPSNFDKLSFVRYMKNIGRAYRKQAVELVSLCRTFVQAQEQSPGSDAKPELRTALKAVDDALGSAAEVKKRPSKDVDEKFAKAIEVLSCYEKHHHPWHVRPVSERMAAAKANDKSTSTVLNVLKEMLCQKATDDRQSEATNVVEFHLFNSLPDNNPTIVRQVLGQESNLQEVLWNFSRFKDERRLTLKQNPHFYKDSDLPTSQKEYVGEFRTDPIESFQHAKICVLTDKPGRVYLGSDKNTRAFGNIWVPNEAIILKDVCGKLEGENVVQASIQDASNLWYLEEPPLSPTSLPTSPNRPSSTVPAPSTYSVSNGSFQDWREPIRQGLITLETDICIKAMPPSNSSPSSPSPPSPLPSANSGANGSGLPSMLQISTRATSHQISRSARATAVPRRSPVSRLSPRTPAPPSPKAWFVPRPPQSPMAAVPLTNQATLASAASVAPASNDVSQIRASQGSIAGGEPMLLKTPDVSLTVTITSPSGVTGPHKLHTGVSEPGSRGNASNQADIRGPAKKGSAGLAPDRDSTGAPPRMRGTSLSQSSVWQFWNRMCNQIS